MRWVALFLFVIALGLQYRLWIGPGSWADVVSLKREMAAQQQRNQSLQQRNQRLQAEIHDLKNGLRGIEERARNDLGLIREGETFFLVVNPRSRN